MKRTRLKRTPFVRFRFVITLALGLGMTPWPATAQDVPPPGVEATPRECTGRFMAGPAVGIPLGLAAVVTGTTMIAVGTNPLGGAANGGSDPDTGLIAGGSVILAVGLGAFLYSSIKLSKNRKTRRRVCRAGSPDQASSVGSMKLHRRVVLQGAGFRF